MLSADMLFDLSGFSHAALFSSDRPVWSALQDLKRVGYKVELSQGLRKQAAFTTGWGLQHSLQIREIGFNAIQRALRQLVA